jgi:Putative beta-barrel porin 2
VRLGSVTVSPGMVFSTGYDTNVTHETPSFSDHETFVVPQAAAWLPLGSARVTGTGAFEWVNFRRHPSEGFRNNREGARVDFLNRLIRPYADYQRRDTFARPTGSELSFRSRRVENEGSAGVAVTMPKMMVNASIRDLKIAYDADAMLLGSSLAEKLNRRIRSETVGVKYPVTPLTSVGAQFGALQDRFSLSPERDANSLNLLGSVEFKRPALVFGTFTAGYNRFRPTRPVARPFDGWSASGNINYLRNGSLVSFQLDRGLNYSYDLAAQYYVLTGWSLAYTRTLGQRWDAMGFGALYKSDYRPAGLLASIGRVDYEHVYGATLGYRLRQGLRTGVTFERFRKEGPLPFEGTRVTTFLMYGSPPFQRLDRPLPYQR